MIVVQFILLLIYWLKVALGMEVLESKKQLWMSVIIFENFKVSGLKLIKPGVAVHALISFSTQEACRRTEFETSLGYIVKPCLKGGKKIFLKLSTWFCI